MKCYSVIDIITYIRYVGAGNAAARGAGTRRHSPGTDGSLQAIQNLPAMSPPVYFPEVSRNSARQQNCTRHPLGGCRSRMQSSPVRRARVEPRVSAET
jgi:hypothetical protein